MAWAGDRLHAIHRLPFLSDRTPGRSGRIENMGSVKCVGAGGRFVFGLLLLFGVSVPSVRADLHFRQSRIQRGTVRSGVSLSQRFEFVNRGPGTVTITDLRASCGCLAPRLAKRIYQPGESGAILLEVNTLSQPAGSNPWRVEVRYRHAGQEQVENLDLPEKRITEVKGEP